MSCLALRSTMPESYSLCSGIVVVANETISKKSSDLYTKAPYAFFEAPAKDKILWTREQHEQHFKELCFVMESNFNRLGIFFIGSIVATVAVFVFTSLAVTLGTAVVFIIIGRYGVLPYTENNVRQKWVPFVRQIQLRSQKVWNEGMTAANWPPMVGNVPEKIRTLPIEQQQAYWSQYRNANGFSENYMKTLLVDMTNGKWSSVEAALYVNGLPTSIQ